jgi:hypothetical protein
LSLCCRKTCRTITTTTPLPPPFILHTGRNSSGQAFLTSVQAALLSPKLDALPRRSSAAVAGCHDLVILDPNWLTKFMSTIVGVTARPNKVACVAVVCVCMRARPVCVE